jgi:hypothetical protein
MGAGARRHTPFEQLGVDTRLVVRRSFFSRHHRGGPPCAILKLAGQNKGEMEPPDVGVDFQGLLS